MQELLEAWKNGGGLWPLLSALVEHAEESQKFAGPLCELRAQLEALQSSMVAAAARVEALEARPQNWAEQPDAQIPKLNRARGHMELLRQERDAAVKRANATDKELAEVRVVLQVPCGTPTVRAAAEIVARAEKAEKAFDAGWIAEKILSSVKELNVGWIAEKLALSNKIKELTEALVAKHEDLQNTRVKYDRFAMACAQIEGLLYDAGKTSDYAIVHKNALAVLDIVIRARQENQRLKSGG